MILLKKIRDELFFKDIKKVKGELKNSLVIFDQNWVKYEEKYIDEHINVGK